MGTIPIYHNTHDGNQHSAVLQDCQGSEVHQEADGHAVEKHDQIHCQAST